MNPSSQKTTMTSMAIIAIVAAFELFGLLVMTLVTTILQQAEAVTDRIVSMFFSPGSIVCPNGSIIDENVYMAFKVQKTIIYSLYLGVLL